MKKNLILALLFAAFSFGAASAQNQANSPVPMEASIQAMANEVIANQTNDPEAANKSFAKLLSKVKKDKEQLTAVGQFFLDQKIYPCANQCAKQVYQLDPTYVPGLMLSGRVCILRKDWGGAGQKFDEVLNYEPDNIEALKLSARVYKYVNPIVAQETLKKILEKEPENLDAHKELGDIAYTNQSFKDAAKAYKTVFDHTKELTLENVPAGVNYLTALMLTGGDAFTIKELAQKLLPLDPKNFALRSLLFFTDIETMDYQKAKEDIVYIENKEYPDSVYRYTDYQYAARYFNEALNDKDAAIRYYKKAAEKDSLRPDTYKEIATLMRTNKQAIEAIPYMEKYIKLRGEKADSKDRFSLGLTYIAAKSQATSDEERNKLIEAGDKVFEQYMTELPNNYVGPFYRAQLWITDGQKAEDKPREFYLKAIELIGNNADYIDQKKAALTYLMVYHLKKNEDAKCKEYVNEILKLDPNNATAKKVQSVLK